MRVSERGQCSQGDQSRAPPRQIFLRGRRPARTPNNARESWALFGAAPLLTAHVVPLLAQRLLSAKQNMPVLAVQVPVPQRQPSALGVSLERAPPLQLLGPLEPPFGSFEVLYCEGPEGPPLAEGDSAADESLDLLCRQASLTSLAS